MYSLLQAGGAAVFRTDSRISSFANELSNKKQQSDKEYPHNAAPNGGIIIHEAEDVPHVPSITISCFSNYFVDLILKSHPYQLATSLY